MTRVCLGVLLNGCAVSLLQRGWRRAEKRWAGGIDMDVNEPTTLRSGVTVVSRRIGCKGGRRLQQMVRFSRKQGRVPLNM